MCIMNAITDTYQKSTGIISVVPFECHTLTFNVNIFGFWVRPAGQEKRCEDDRILDRGRNERQYLGLARQMTRIQHRSVEVEE